MTGDTLQEFATLALLVLAGGYLARRTWILFGGKPGASGGCGSGGCGSCASSKPAGGSCGSSPEVISIGGPGPRKSV